MKKPEEMPANRVDNPAHGQEPDQEINSEVTSESESLTNQEAKIYTAYSPEADITFIMEDKANTTRVAGFYYGQPNEKSTQEFYGKLSAEFD